MIIGSCTSCDGTPIISESKHFQLNKNKQGETIVKVRGGILELSKFQIGCCSGARGHGCPFLLKAEIVTENSPLKGRVSYSLPIDVGAKVKNLTDSSRLSFEPPRIETCSPIVPRPFVSPR